MKVFSKLRYSKTVCHKSLNLVSFEASKPRLLIRRVAIFPDTLNHPVNRLQTRNSKFEKLSLPSLSLQINKISSKNCKICVIILILNNFIFFKLKKISKKPVVFQGSAYTYLRLEFFIIQFLYLFSYILEIVLNLAGF